MNDIAAIATIAILGSGMAYAIIGHAKAAVLIPIKKTNR